MSVAIMHGQGASSATEGTADVVKPIMKAEDLNVNLQAIPEPATYMLLGLGILVCAQQFRRKKK